MLCVPGAWSVCLYVVCPWCLECVSACQVKSSQVIFISRAHLKTTDVDQSALHTRLIQAKTGQTQRSIKTSEWE